MNEDNLPHCEHRASRTKQIVARVLNRVHSRAHLSHLEREHIMKKLTLAFSLFASTISYSGIAMARAWGTAAVGITSIAVSDGNTTQTTGVTVGIFFNGAPVTGTGCAAGDAGQWVVDPNRDVKSILATASAAKIAGRTVRVLWDSANACSGTYPILEGIWVQ
jgi:hypothetical protein